MRNILLWTEGDMNYFPTYLALDKAFCNRKKELQKLFYNIENTNPSLVISPRRYGKTSLIINALTCLKLSYIWIDFYKALTKEDIEIFILNGIGKLLGQLETTPKKLMNLANEFFASMQIRVVLSNNGIALDFSKRTKKTTNVSMILDALEKLQNLASQKKKKVVLFFDEFQVIGEISKDYSIEAVVREAAQKSRNVVYIFSGSNRHLMEQMFYDKKRPFYKLCDLITLERISSKDYQEYIQKAAFRRWGMSLDQEIIDIVFFITERHAYYVNKLCSLLWQGDCLPNKTDVNKTWEKFVLENKSLTERELELLSVNQRKFLIALANRSDIKEPYSKDIVMSLDLPLSSISRALSGLIAKDYVYISNAGIYKILDPLIRSVLSSD
jgi:uncharacterized protein